MSHADEIAESMARQGDLAGVSPQAIPMIKQKLLSNDGWMSLTEGELHLATRMPEYFSPQELQALEMALDQLQRQGRHAYPVMSGNITIPR